jgi:hypothetical protein
MSAGENSPLCPHCLRNGCPWLSAYRVALIDHANGINARLPEPEVCPLELEQEARDIAEADRRVGEETVSLVELVAGIGLSAKMLRDAADAVERAELAARTDPA